MGFDASICVYPKYKDVTYKDIRVINSIIEYETSDWAKQHFQSAVEYAKYNCGDEYKEQSDDAVDFYRNNRVRDEYGYYHLYKDFANWCSNGSGEIYNFIVSLGTQVYDNEVGIRILSRKNIAEFMMFCLDRLDGYTPKSAKIKYAYKYKRNEDGEIDDDADITLFTCDGFEVDFTDNGTSKRIDTNPEWELDFGFPERYFDDWEVSGYKEGIQACAMMLGEVDFENSFVIYNGGW